MVFLLIMNGRSFLRDAIYSYFCGQMPDVEMIMCECPEEVSGLTSDHRARLKLVLLHIGERDAGSPEILTDLKHIRTILNGTPTVLIGENAEATQAAAALRAGAMGYIPEALSSEIVRHALPLVAEGGVFAPPYVYAEIGAGAAKLAASTFSEPSAEWGDDLSVLTEREIEVLRLLAAGQPNKVIAFELSLKEGTVKVHMRNIMRKLKVTSRTQAALLASRQLDRKHAGK